MILGTLDVKAVVFVSPHNPDHSYVVGLDAMNYLDFIDKYDGTKCKRADSFNFEDDYSGFFMVYNEDCFDPPVAIIRCGSAMDAEDMFVEEFDWSPRVNIGEDDYTEDNVQWTSGGIPYDSEGIKVYPVKIRCIEM